MKFLSLIVLSLLSGAVSCASSWGAERARNFDLLVYGGTASGVMTAYSAAQEGLRVVLLEPGAHLGGMVTGGLSATDVGHASIIGGYARNFYVQAAAHYGVRDLDRLENWFSEPHVGEAILQKMLENAGVVVVYHQKLRETGGVERKGARILSIATLDGQRWKAKVFADCSYEGDLMANAKVSYTWGRESSATYREDLAGVRAHTPQHQFAWPLPAYDNTLKLLPEIAAGPLAAPGSGDRKVQAYNFRLILTNDPANRIEITMPVGYNRERFVLLANYLAGFELHFRRAPVLDDLFNARTIPGSKRDFNNNGPFSTDYIGHSWLYPEASYASKMAIWQDHLLYVQSLVYFLTHDPAVPAALRAEVGQWGLPKDEFADTGHWPGQLYIREGRRMTGAYVMRQSDLQSQRIKPDSIGMGSYNSDSHNAQRVAMPDGSVQNEGDVQVSVEPYEIPYRAITPLRHEAENLLVPVCLSASHVAYSSMRMEPQYMIIGQAAGVAAALAIHHHSALQDIAIPELQNTLRRHGAVLHLEEQLPGEPRIP